MKKICSGAPILAAPSHTKNPDSPPGKELDIHTATSWNTKTHSYIMEHEDSEHWWLAEDNKGQVGYVPGRGSTDGTKIGWKMRPDGERRHTYSAAVINRIKRNSRIYVGYSIVRKMDSRLSMGRML